MFDLEAWKLFLPYHKKFEIIARWFIQCTGYMIPNGQQHSYTHHIICSYQRGPWEQNCSNQIMNHQSYTFKSKIMKVCRAIIRNRETHTILLIPSNHPHPWHTHGLVDACEASLTWSFHSEIHFPVSGYSRHSNHWFDLPLITEKLESVPSLLPTLLELVYPR
jgi:hypothetical protein